MFEFNTFETNGIALIRAATVKESVNAYGLLIKLSTKSSDTKFTYPINHAAQTCLRANR